MSARRAKIVTVPGVCGGEPVIEGTRVTVSNVLRVLMCSDGATMVRDAYPHLTDEQVVAALKYAEGKV